MDLDLTRLDGDTPTDDPNTATRLIIRANGTRAMVLLRATHPMFGVQGYTLTPHPKDPNAHLSAYYDPDAFTGGYLDHRIQNRMWVDPDMDQAPDVTRDPANWPTLHDLLTTLRPLLKG